MTTTRDRLINLVATRLVEDGTDLMATNFQTFVSEQIDRPDAAAMYEEIGGLRSSYRAWVHLVNAIRQQVQHQRLNNVIAHRRAQ